MEKIKQGNKPPPLSGAPIPPGVAIPGAFSQPQPLAPRTVPLQPQPFPCYGTPPFFQSMNKRRGKWTAEEEEYALFIIKQFEKGVLRECENGTTLRAFLSRKLHCAPMRISKKYAGKSIGKLVFCLQTTMDGASLVAVDRKLKELEVRFYKSLYEEMHPSQLQGFMAHYRPQMTIPPVIPTAFMPQPVIMPPTVASAQQVSQVQASAVHTKSLQQAYLSALNQLINPHGQPTAPPTNNGTATAVVSQQVPITPAVVMQQTPSVSFVAPIPPLTRSTAAEVPTANAAAALAPKPRQPEAKNHAPSSEVPDFLSGFEKVSGEDHRPPWMMPGAPLFGGLQGHGGSLQCSPPLTSKSFDDLHQMLGSDLSPEPLDLNASRKDSGYLLQQSPQRSPTLTNNADIYAAFAQQSAEAVSQHSAYSRTDRSLAETSGVHPVAPVAGQVMSSNLAALYGSEPMVNSANLRVLQGQPKLNTQTSFASNGARLVSGSERSSDVGSNEDGGSMHGSSVSNVGASDTTSNDSDSISDEGPPRKKVKTWGENAISAAQATSPVSSDRSSPRAQ